MIVANIAIFYLFNKHMQTEQLKWEYEMLTLQNELQEDYYAALIRRDAEIRKLDHDMKNHFAYLQYHADKEEWDTVKNYLAQMTETVNNNKIHYTNQMAINAILNIKNEQAKEKGTKLNIMASKELTLERITDMDLVILLANCLDNAIEAVEKISDSESRKINFVMTNDSAGISILVENPIDKVIDITDLQTTKPEKNKHGLGIKNIKSIVKKYDGIHQMTVEDKTFKVKLFLPNQ